MKKLSLILKFLATGSATMLLAACYGTYEAMYGMPVYDRSGSFQIVDADTDEPIAGLKVLFTDEEGTYAYSDDLGTVSYNLYTTETGEMNVFIEDVDGDSNGAYPSGYQTLDDDDDTVDVISLQSE